MVRESMKRRHLFGGGIAFAGLVLTAIQIVQGLQQLDTFNGEERGIVFTFETIPFVLIGLTLVFVGYWLTTQDEYEQYFPQIAAWAVGSTVLFASVSALIIFSQQVKPTVDILDQAGFIAMNHITIGAVVGVLVGMYDARSRARQQALEQERDRVEMFAKKSMDINTYGRELNRIDSVDGVSALCIESIQGLLGLSETAFVVRNGDEYELIDNTVVNAPEEALIELARQSRDQEPTTVVEHDSLPTDLQADSAVSLLISDHDDASAVLLALTDEETSFNEEDIQLLEMLLTHASTALDQIYHSTEPSSA